MTDREAFITLFNRMDDVISRMPVCYDDILGIDEDVTEQGWRYFHDVIKAGDKE